jgi:hypothetical protein
MTYLFNKHFKNIINHNKKYFKFKDYQTNNKILVEFNNWGSLHIANSYLLKNLAEKYKANIYAYPGYTLLSTELPINIYNKIKWFIGKIFSIKFFGVYKSLGVTNFISPNISKDIKKEGDKIFLLVKKKLKNNYDIENIKLKNIWVGDLIYDSYLLYYSTNTIKLGDQLFDSYLRKSIYLFLFWYYYFFKNNINAVVLSHTVYSIGILARICLKKKIKVYVCQPDYINCLSKKLPYARYEFYYANKTLKRVKNKILDKGLAYSKKRIENHIKGKRIDIWWTPNNPFASKLKDRLLSNNKKYKFLIASHSFTDAPHAYGKNLFPDNYLWLDFIGKTTLKSEHEYYLKAHPNLYEKEKKFNYETLREFVKIYPHIKLLPLNAGHNQLIKEGINCVLTVLGTIGFEYPLFGIPVVNASLKNATLNFNFNLHINSLAQYKSLLLNPKKINLKIKKNEIYKYYFFRHVLITPNWLFNDINLTRTKYNIYNKNIYSYWIKNEFNFNKHTKILESVKKYINSNKYILDYKFLDRNILDDMNKSNYYKNLEI